MAPQSIKLVIFDCDGVLVDSELLASQADVAALQDCGAQVDLADVLRNFTGKGIAEITAIARTRYGVRDSTAFLQAKQRHTFALFRSSLRPVDGITTLLENLRQRGQAFCVASNSPRNRLELTLRTVGLLSLFGLRFYSADEVARGKPAPDLFLYAAKQNQACPDECVVIEDSPTGIRAAKAAGMYCAAFTGTNHLGNIWIEQLLAAGADETFANFHHFPFFRQ